MVTASCDWASWRYDPAHSGTNSTEHAINAANASQLLEGWSAKTDGPVLSSAAMAGGTTYVGSEDGNLYSYDSGGRAGCYGSAPRNCFPLWIGATGGPVDSSPAISGSQVFVGSGDGKLYAFNTTPTGCGGYTPCAPAWTFSTGGAITASPTVVGSTIYIASRDGKLYAISTTGTLLWSATLGGASYSSPALANGEVVVGADDGKVSAFDANGTTNCALGSPVTCSPIWSTDTGSAVRSSPSIAGGRVFIGSNNGKIYGLNATTGAVLWATTTGGPVTASPAVANGRIFIGSADGKLYALNSVTGAVQWTATTGGAIGGSPAVANGIVYVGSTDGQLTGYDAGGATNCSGSPTSCAPLWSAAAGAWIGASPTITNGMLVLGSSDGVVRSWRLPRPPLSPTAATATLIGPESFGDIHVAWAAPDDDGGSPVTSYVVEVSTDAGANWSSAGTVPAGTLGLDNHCGASGTTCTYRVSAINSHGSSGGGPDTTPVTIPTQNSAPVFSLGASPSAGDDGSLHTIDGFVTLTSAGPLPGETVTYTVTNDNHSIFSGQPAIDAAGTLTFTPSNSVPSGGVANVSVTAQNNGGTDYGGVDTSASQSFQITINHLNKPPVAGGFSSSTRGNTAKSVVAPGLLANDTDPEGGALHECGVDATSTQGGSVTAQSDGSFTYTPPVGYLGADSFGYHVCDAQNASTADTVSLTVHGPVVWYVDNSQVTNGDGRSSSPFNDLASAGAATSVTTPGQIIYVRGTGSSTGLSNGIALKDHVQLIGSGVALTLQPDNPDLAAATPPVLKLPSSPGVLTGAVQLGNGNLIAGFTIDGTSGTTIPAVSGQAITGAAIQALRLQNLPADGIVLVNAAGTVGVESTTVTSVHGDGIRALDSTGTELDLTVHNSTVDNTSANGHGIFLRTGAGGGPPNLIATLTNDTFTRIDNGANAIDAATTTGGVLALTITNGSFDNVTSLHPQGNNAVRVTNDGPGATLLLDVENNTIRNWTGDAISIRTRGNGAQLGSLSAPTYANVLGNTIGDTNDLTVVGSQHGHGISAQLDDHPGAASSSGLVQVANNHVAGTYRDAISISSRHGTTTTAANLLRVLVANNVLRLGALSAGDGVHITTSDVTQVCAAISGNNAVDSGDGTAFELTQLGLSSLAVLHTNGANPANQIDLNNTGTATVTTGTPILVAPNTNNCGNP